MIMPQPLFPKLPWLKQAEHGIQNRQRCTVLIISKKVKRKPPSAFTVTSRGLIRFRASDRSVVLRKSDNGAPQPAMHTQWSQAPTEELGRLLSVMRGAPRLQRNSLTRSAVVTFPPTGMYFLSCLPEGVLDNPSRKQYALTDDEFFWPWLGLYNSHLFHAYWLMIGDAFHVTATEYGTVRRPPGWRDEGLRTRTERTARRLMHKRTLDACHTVKRNRGEQHNINFHKGSAGPMIVEQLDQLLLEAYRLPKEPLMRQMRTIRTSSAHRL